MASIQPRALPSDALLARYAQAGAYTDCYATEVPGSVTFVRFVTAFYTSGLFKLERFILRWALARPSTDVEAAQLAAGARGSFAAWDVEARAEDQILLRDLAGRTRSWLMVRALDGGAGTRLYFGSAVVPERDARTGLPSMGFGFRALLRFHRRYSIALLAAARRRVS
jgi:hypothetical protein